MGCTLVRVGECGILAPVCDAGWVSGKCIVCSPVHRIVKRDSPEDNLTTRVGRREDGGLVDTAATATAVEPNGGRSEHSECKQWVLKASSYVMRITSIVILC